MKRYIIRKFIMAKSATDAMAKDAKTPIDDVALDEAWLAENDRKQRSFGFKTINKKK